MPPLQKLFSLATTLLFLSSPFFVNNAMSAPLNIVSTAAPIHAMLVQLTRDAQKPQLLLPPNIMPHGARLTPSQARVLQNADLLVLVGGGFAAFESRVESSPTRRVIRLTKLKGITTLPLVEEHDEEGHEKGHDEEGHEEKGHDEEEGHEEEHDEEEEHRHEGSVDPHLWLDIKNVRVIVKRLSEILTQRDPANAALYRKNARKQNLALRALDQEVRALVREISGNVFVGKFLVLHDATAYFTARYGIRGKERLYAAHHNATRDGMRHTLRVRKKLRSGDYRCVIVQPQLPREVRERLLGSETRVVVIDPLGDSSVNSSVDSSGTSPRQDETFYARLLTSVAEGFRECLVR